MPGSRLASRRVALTCTLVGIAAGIAGCSTTSASSVTVSGDNLTIYASASPTGDPRVSADVLDAERLAFSQTGSQFGKFTVRLATLTAGKVSDNARTAIQDKNAIAYLGEIPPSRSGDSLGITNGQDLLQVTPTDTAVELTRSTPAVAGSPGVYYESQSTYGRTFARVVPTTALEAKAQVEEMQALGVHKLYVTDDGSPYGSAIALAVKQGAPSGISVVSGPATAAGAVAAAPDAVFVGASTDGVAGLIRSIAGEDPRTKVFVPSALDDATFAAAVGSANLYASAPGFLPSDLTQSGRRFVADFSATYHHAPGTQAIFGYEAMSAVLAVLREAGSAANNRATVVHDFFAIKNRASVLGTYSIDSAGDTSLAPFVFSRLRGGAMVPSAFVSVQG